MHLWKPFDRGQNQRGSRAYVYMRVLQKSHSARYTHTLLLCFSICRRKKYTQKKFYDFSSQLSELYNSFITNHSVIWKQASSVKHLEPSWIFQAEALLLKINWFMWTPGGTPRWQSFGSKPQGERNNGCTIVENTVTRTNFLLTWVEKPHNWNHK